MKDTEAKKGMKFNYLTMITDSYIKNHRRYALFRCECGKEKELRVSNVIDPKGTKSCGCMCKKLNLLKKHNYKHGLCRTRIYKIWHKMQVRTENPNYPEFYLYGGRGIKVCKEWKDDFMVFYRWSIEHGYADNLSIDRIDVNGNYEPNNCRWATTEEQCNNKRTNLYLTHMGETLTLTQWCRKYGVCYNSARLRYHKGLNAEQILFGKK